MSMSGLLIPGRLGAISSIYTQLTPFLLPWLMTP